MSDTAIQAVVADAAGQAVVIITALERVIPRTARERIGTRTSSEEIGGGGTGDRIRPRATGHVLDIDDRIGLAARNALSGGRSEIDRAGCGRKIGRAPRGESGCQ